MAHAILGGIIATLIWFALFALYRTIGADVDVGTLIGSLVALAVTAALVLVARTAEAPRARG